MIVFLAVAALLVAAIALFMNRPEFGRAPRGERLERIWRSPNYRDGAFRNRHATPQLTSGKGWWATMYDFLFERKERNRPDHALPAVKTDLKALDPKENLLVWFGLLPDSGRRAAYSGRSRFRNGFARAVFQQTFRGDRSL